MSEQTKAALEAALEAHLADEHEDPTMILDSYILQASGRGIADNRRGIIYCGLANQSTVDSLGLLAFIDYNVNALAFGGDDE